jgi:hypothetical protein
VVKLVDVHEIFHFFDAAIRVKVVVFRANAKKWKVVLEFWVILAEIDEKKRQNGRKHEKKIASPIFAQFVQDSSRVHLKST